jgi:hypothetical protein
MYGVADNIVGTPVGISDMARYLTLNYAVTRKREWLGWLVAVLYHKLGIIDGPAVETRTGAGL